ncbi:MAG TPA: NAD-dependent succinate-semialdehyde dehydrogenase [Stellaceae bacterium]|jgi:succinate-semialdehyde dehydrogenase/glutarate-semialdehyde dehydrogenase|nr:NAD-dependent succinate-semialdehyde dehydrogenase [Stellaceae bacterium]
MIEAVNPTTGERIARYEEMSADAVKRAVETAHGQFRTWRTTNFAHRAGLMRQAAAVLRAKAKDYGRLMAEEMGKPVKDGIAEANKSALGCDYYADHAEQFLAPEIVPTDARKSFVAFQPIGVVLAVMPWNFPFWQVFRAAAPALMAGNAMVLKHASNVPGCALAIEKVFAEAGFPEGLFRTLMIGSKAVDAVIEHPLVQGVTLTGSTAAGRAVAAKAGHMLKKTVLELGGSDAYVVLDDADIEQAAQISTKGRLVNSGQSCIAAKRFIVTGKNRAAFEAAFVKQMSAVKMGDPLDESNVVGPQARHDLRDALHRQVQGSIAKGAKCLLGGAIPNNKGAFYPPTILTEVKPGMPAYDEEMFGPVAAIIPVADEEQAFAAANDSVFGLGGAIIGRDLARAERLAVERMESGTVFVNEAVRSDPRLPFGGIKESGYGRELSAFGIREFVNIKTIFIA